MPVPLGEFAVAVEDESVDAGGGLVDQCVGAVGHAVLASELDALGERLQRNRIDRPDKLIDLVQRHPLGEAGPGIADLLCLNSVAKDRIGRAHRLVPVLGLGVRAQKRHVPLERVGLASFLPVGLLRRDGAGGAGDEKQWGEEGEEVCWSHGCAPWVCGGVGGVATGERGK